jgi:putative methylase
LGAKSVVGVDVDVDAIRTAVLNRSQLGVEVDFITGDIDCVRGNFDVAIMNPPFGCWKRGADLRFLRKAVEIGNTVYSLHKRNERSRRFLSEAVGELGAVVNAIYEVEVVIRRTMEFHKRKRYKVQADLFRITKVD